MFFSDENRIVEMTPDPPQQMVNTSGTTIISPNFPNNYPENTDSILTITFKEEQNVSIQFKSFELEDTLNGEGKCNGDWLELRDGNSSGSSLLGPKLCGDMNPGKKISTGDSMTLVFHSNLGTTRAGFIIKAQARGKSE